MKISNLTKIYSGKKVLDIDELNIDESKITALMGSNGSGKSTLLRLINEMEKPDSGIIQKSTDISQISMFLPEPVLLKRSVRKNFEFVLSLKGLKSEFDARVSEVLRVVGLDESFLKKDYFELSSGQSARVAFALAIILKNPLILLDEPTNSIDISTSKLFAKEIKRLNREFGIGFITSSHDEKWLSELADDLVFLHDGRVSEFELKNIFKNSGGVIEFGGADLENEPKNSLNLASNLANFTQIAINPRKIALSNLPKDGYKQGFLHSISVVYGDELLVKIKFGDFLIKAIVKASDYDASPLITSQKVYFYIENDAFLGLK
ncbi:MAG: ABC transporter ATP-binding protein [Campylobacter sp.]|nr:ABC transporter ATP-binding protein [Campylobacter sp.]